MRAKSVVLFRSASMSVVPRNEGVPLENGVNMIYTSF